MSSSQSRIGVLAAIFLLAAGVVLVHLFVVMVVDHEEWAARSHQNRWAFRSVPSLRGAIHDRNGRVLAHDEPTMQVTLFYRRFRMYHPVGAAVHGATTWARLSPGRELATYSYREGRLGPGAAVRDLLAIPVSSFRRGALPKGPAAVLATAVTTVLSATTGMPRRRVFRALRDAAEQRGWLGCGEVLDGFTAAEILASYDRALDALLGFDARLLASPEMQASSRRPGLVERLEWQRRASLEQRTLTWIGDDGELQRGELYENMEWPVAEYVPFGLAAPLRIGAAAHPGLRVRPGVQRLVTAPEGSSLEVLLGLVRDVGRSEPEGWFERYVDREMPERWLEDMVPEEAALSDEDRRAMQRDAERSFRRLTRRHERRGIAGFEATFDAELTGRLGMRLVERDSRQREQLMWSSLRVRSGDDVAVTIDAELQELAEGLVTAAWRDALARHGPLGDNERGYVQAALAVVDAHSGDVLAYAGAPVSTEAGGMLPGLTWRAGSLGSLVKPFVLLEQLLSETDGRPHTPLHELAQCSGEFRFGGRRLRCDHRHWEEGRHPIMALAKSCNLFFYQVGVGLQRDGLTRALQRFGLQPARAGSEFAACWQRRVRGIPWSWPVVEAGRLLPTSAIGYGVCASPLAVARAYAGLATGRLPRLGVLAGETRPSVLLADIGPELEVVRAGLQQCVQAGTADGVPALARFGVHGKTGTAEVGEVENENNAWFAGYLPWTANAGVQLCFCSVIYWVPDGTHGAEAAGGIVADLLEGIEAAPRLRDRYILPAGAGSGGGR